MPVTPYHFGPSGLIGYIFRKWIDLPVFVLANVVVDVEVLLNPFMNLGRPYHRLCHTFLIGAVIGAVWGLVAWLGLPVLNWFMKIIRIPYQTNAFKMIISGILGVWFHVLIDGIYHYDVKPFWPMQKNPLWRLLSKSQVEWICIACLAIFILLYIFSLKRQAAKKQ
ncbi:MAG: hypothetical protein KJ757_05925 [Planctomycetes bacterium]|nr:hypothetical protein [Planctomycetota bacterium]MBU1518108.1 hypothetical protein [Planctomycetota bacterium]MBU2458642.1 hypothetical protein [Planctomycetota bacterium]MBU2597076.1 hypothetical protein [Planctomycetota bacterium]